MKIFLSHKGTDKPRVREYKRVLEVLGFQPWLDEDAMPSGTTLDRGILAGMKDSCAAVFFVTTNFVDAGFLGAELDYAIAEKRTRGDSFAIVTLQFETDGVKGKVPDLVERYVWKEPKSDLEGLWEILKAIPLKVGPVRPR